MRNQVLQERTRARKVASEREKERERKRQRQTQKDRQRKREVWEPHSASLAANLQTSYPAAPQFDRFLDGGARFEAVHVSAGRPGRGRAEFCEPAS